MKKRFHITYERGVDLQACDARYRGFLPKSKDVPERNNVPKKPALFTLKEVKELICGNHPEADSYPCWVPRWVNVEIPHESFIKADPNIRLSVHLENISDSSARRIARLLGVKLAKMI